MVAILLVFGILSCTGEGKAGAYENYMEDMRRVATGSDRIGRDLDEALTTPGVKPNQLATTLDGLADLQQQQLGRPKAIQAPGAMSDEPSRGAAIARLQGDGHAAARRRVRATAGSDDASGASLQLAAGESPGCERRHLGRPVPRGFARPDAI